MAKGASLASQRFDPSQKFHGHALVVDDVALNQAVACKMLEKVGLTTAAVSSGQEALARLDQEHFDLVFMDCNMPDMDGFETSRLIRSSVATSTADVPIIAMTASAMKGDMDKCLKAGMNDYISKPIIPQQLLDVVSRWVRMQIPGSTAPARPPSNRKPIMDRQIIEQLQSLVPLAHRSNLINELFESFAAMLPPTLEKMRSAVIKGDRKTLGLEAHKIKSVGAALGAARFAAVCQTLESMPELTPKAEVMTCLEQMAMEFVSFSAALHQALGGTGQRNSA
jgi:CheY-like chemotaxis protein